MRLGCGDPDVHLDTDRSEGRVEQFRVGVGEDRETPAAVPQLLERTRHLREGTP